MKWKYKIDIKQYINDDCSIEGMQQAYTGITKELEQIPLPTPAMWTHYTKMALEYGDINIFNLALDSLYNWADSHKIWLGM